MKAVDEPAYLSVGTDVSAKYRGAFCEAKIKTVKRLVKVKVNLKGESTSQVVQDDQVKGPLRVGSTVEVKTNEGLSSEAVISKLTDASLYTVVFDDGDEKTLRRTSLCLKGERHFAESETLDQLPLTNPEHFGTPVIKKNRGGRRSNQAVADEEHESSSSEEEEEDTRRLNDELIGKVCSVQTGPDGNQWYLGLVVAPSCNDEMTVKREQCLVRSFADSKFFTVARKDLHEVKPENIMKPDICSRKGHDGAHLFMRCQEVPDVWKMDLSQILESSSSEDDDVEEKESEEEEDEEVVKKKKNIKEEPDDEPDPEERDHFLQQLYKFMEDRGTPINKPPVLGYKDLNLFKLFRLVYQLGGCRNIESGTVWKQVYMDLGIPVLNSAASYNVKTAYKKYLAGFEEYCRSASITFRTIHHNKPRLPTTLTNPKPAWVEVQAPPPIKTEPVDDKPRVQVESESESEKEEEPKDRHTSPRGVRRCQLKMESPPVSSRERQTEERQTDGGEETSGEEREPPPIRRRSNRRMEESESEEEDEEYDEAERRRGGGDSDGEDDDSITGTKVRVKYGRGKTQKIYEANIKKTQTDEGDILYLVHYYGWNVRYDEWVKADRIIWPVEKGTTKKRNRKKVKNKEDGGDKEEEEPSASKAGSVKRGRPQVRTTPTMTADRSVSKTPSSEGGHSSSSRPHSSHMANGDSTPRRRTRRTSGMYDSDRASNESNSSDSDPEDSSEDRTSTCLQQEDEEDEEDASRKTPPNSGTMETNAAPPTLPPCGGTPRERPDKALLAQPEKRECPDKPLLAQPEKRDRPDKALLAQPEKSEPGKGEDPAPVAACPSTPDRGVGEVSPIRDERHKASPSAGQTTPPARPDASPAARRSDGSDRAQNSSSSPAARRSDGPDRTQNSSSSPAARSDVVPERAQNSSSSPAARRDVVPDRAQNSSSSPASRRDVVPERAQNSSSSPAARRSEGPDRAQNSSSSPAARRDVGPDRAQNSSSSPLSSHDGSKPSPPLPSPRVKGRRSNVREAGCETPPRNGASVAVTPATPPSPSPSRGASPASVSTATKPAPVASASPSSVVVTTTTCSVSITRPSSPATSPASVTSSSSTATSPASVTTTANHTGSLLCVKRQEEPMVVLHCLPPQLRLPPEATSTAAHDSDTDSAPEEDERSAAGGVATGGLGAETAGVPGGAVVKRKATEQRTPDKKVRLESRTASSAGGGPPMPKMAAVSPKTAASSPKALPSPARRSDSERRSDVSRRAKEHASPPPPEEEEEEEVKMEMPCLSPEICSSSPQQRLPAVPTTQLHHQAQQGPTVEELMPQIGPEALVCHEVDLDDQDDKETPNLLLMMREAPPPPPHPPPHPHHHLLHTQASSAQSRAFPHGPPPGLEEEDDEDEELDEEEEEEEEERGAICREAQDGPVDHEPGHVSSSNSSLSLHDTKDRGQKRLMDGNTSPSAKKHKRNQKRSSTANKTDKNGAGHSSDSEDQASKLSPVKHSLPKGPRLTPGLPKGPRLSPALESYRDKTGFSSSQRTYKWTFQLRSLFGDGPGELDGLSSSERIAYLQDKLQDIRRYYMSLKSEVASIDRRRKRMKKKDREVSVTPASTSSGSSDMCLSPSGSSPSQNTVALECR